MNSWSKRAASGTFAALTLAVVVGGGMVLAGAVFCSWIIGAYPPDTAYPIALLTCLAPAAAAAAAFALMLKGGQREATDSAHPLLNVLTDASQASRPLGGLILACFAAGVMLGARAAHPPASHHPRT